jgi:hypothetical protein
VRKIATLALLVLALAAMAGTAAANIGGVIEPFRAGQHQP